MVTWSRPAMGAQCPQHFMQPTFPAALRNNRQFLRNISEQFYLCLNWHKIYLIYFYYPAEIYLNLWRWEFNIFYLFFRNFVEVAKCVCVRTLFLGLKARSIIGVRTKVNL